MEWLERVGGVARRMITMLKENLAVAIVESLNSVWRR